MDGLMRDPQTLAERRKTQEFSVAQSPANLHGNDGNAVLPPVTPHLRPRRRSLGAQNGSEEDGAHVALETLST